MADGPRGHQIVVATGSHLPGRRRGRAMQARTQVLVAAVIGTVVGVAAAFTTSSAMAVLLGWDAAAAAYLAWVWWELWPLDPSQTAARAVRADPTRATADLLLLAAAAASMVSVGVVLISAAGANGTGQDVRVALALASIVVSWAVVHTVYALRYAGLYYTGAEGGISFNEDDPPDFADFGYLALTIGMTFQVSDTDLQDKQIRRTATRHALLSYVFGTGVLATTVNLVVSLTTK